MTTTLSEHKVSRSVSWEEAMYPGLRDPEDAKCFLESCIEESETPCMIGSALSDVIKANRDRPFVAYQVVCAYSSHLAILDIPLIVEALKSLEPTHQEYLGDLYWLLHLLEETLSHGGVKYVQLKAELSPGNMPEQFKISPEYQQWEKAAVA